MQPLKVPNNSDYDDNQLLDSYLASNDMVFLGQLYARHSEMVYYVCLRYFKDTEKSKDAVMQIFEELTVKVKRQEIHNFPKWLYVVSKNYCLMMLRSNKNHPEVFTDSFVEFEVYMHPEDNNQEKEEQLLQLEHCMEKLPEKQRITVDLFFIKETCYKDIVEVTGFTMKAVKSYIQNGKRNLKNCMDRSHE
ncbi:RNA polymerase sigma factor [Sphingobacterium sp. Mn56C]|uniref:RNA polymerase sigma factor n=1 Tax=Sphingobacterium sp. Mn56C TaxID=3395261 RepID=UPI003BC61E66